MNSRTQNISNPSTPGKPLPQFQSSFATINRFVTTLIITFSLKSSERERGTSFRRGLLARYHLVWIAPVVNSALRSYLPPPYNVRSHMIRPQSSRLPPLLSINRERGGNQEESTQWETSRNVRWSGGRRRRIETPETETVNGVHEWMKLYRKGKDRHFRKKWFFRGNKSWQVGLSSCFEGSVLLRLNFNC